MFFMFNLEHDRVEVSMPGHLFFPGHSYRDLSLPISNTFGCFFYVDIELFTVLASEVSSDGTAKTGTAKAFQLCLVDLATFVCVCGCVCECSWLAALHIP